MNQPVKLRPRSSRSPGQLAELMAEAQHSIWTGYMTHILAQGEMRPNGNFVLPETVITDWQAMANKDWNELTEDEKQLRRNIITKYFTVLRK